MLTSYRRVLAEPGNAAVQRHRAGRPAADLDGRAGHRPARPGGHRLVRRRRRRLGGLHGRQRRPRHRPGAARRPPRPGPGAERGQRRLRRRHGAAGLVGAGRLADRRDVRSPPRSPAARCPRSARACGPAGPTCSRRPPTCRRRTRWRRWWTRRSSSPARSRSRCWPPPSTRWPAWRWRGRGGRRQPGLRPAARHRATGAPARPLGRAAPAAALAHLAPLGVVSAALGVLFGAAEVTTVAFADEQGHRAWAGGLLALWALGSLTSGVVTGAISWRRGPTSGCAGARWRWRHHGAAGPDRLGAADGAALLVGGSRSRPPWWPPCR